jgi:hypothetical protein
MDIESFAPLVRLYEVLREKELLTGITGHESLELMQDRLEAIIVDLEVFCFKKEQLSIQGFVSLVTNMYSTADNLVFLLHSSGQDDIKQITQMALKAHRLVYVTLTGEPGCDKHNS